MDADGNCVAKDKEIALDDDMKFICMNICKTLAGDYSGIPEDQKEFFEGGECTNFLDEYFDTLIGTKFDTVSKVPENNTLENWIARALLFLDNKYLKKKSGYITLSLLAERQAVIALTERHSYEAVHTSQRLYDILKAEQFRKILGCCRETDKNYMWASEQKV